METNKDTFKAHGYKPNYPWGYYKIEISSDGTAARYQEITHLYKTDKDIISIKGKWQEIRYNKRNGAPYIKCRNKRLYLDEFIRYDI